jgi:hypothetical protein
MRKPKLTPPFVAYDPTVMPGFRRPTGINLKGKVCIVRKTFFKDELQKTLTLEDQKFLAEGGFGCDPVASGTKVFGTWVKDHTEDWVRRGDVEFVEVDRG